MDPTTDGPTRQSDDRHRTHLDSEARRALATPTSLLPLGPKLAYLLLWERAESQPEHIIVRPRDLANEMGLADAKSARDYLEHLGRLGLVDIVDRHRRRGTISLYVYRPADIDDRTARPDPQRRLPLQPARARGDLSGQIPAHSPGGSSGDLSGQSPSPAGDTSYTRTHAGTPAVDVVDVDVVVSTVQEMELRKARSALERTIASWKREQIPEKQWKPNRQNLSTWLKTHTLLLRDRISAAAYDQGALAPLAAHDSSGIRTDVWRIMWGAWEDAIPGYRELLRSLELPAGWHETMASRPRESGQSHTSTAASEPPRRRDQTRTAPPPAENHNASIITAMKFLPRMQSSTADPQEPADAGTDP